MSDVTRQPGFFVSGSQIKTRVKKTVLIAVPTATTDGILIKSTDDSTTKSVLTIEDSGGTKQLDFTFNDSGFYGLALGGGRTTSGAGLQLKTGNVFLENASAVRVKDNAGSYVTVLSVSTANNTTFTAPAIGGSIQIAVPNSSGSIQFRSNGAQRLEITNDGTLNVNGFTASTIGQIIKAAASQTANLTEWQNSSGTAMLKVQPDGDLEFVANNIVTDTTTGTKIGTATNQKLAFFNATPVTQPTEITDELTTITHTAPGTPDYAVQDLVDSGSGSAFGFATKDEGNTVLSVIANLQARVNELEDVLSSLGLVADAD